MYRRLTRKQQEARARKLEAMRRGRDAARMARPACGRAQEGPALDGEADGDVHQASAAAKGEGYEVSKGEGMSNLDDHWKAAEEGLAARLHSAQKRATDGQEALRKDAERYRWLRRDAPYAKCAAIFDKHSGEALDAAIDAAMAGEGKAA